MKVGDRIVCIDASNAPVIVEGNEYTILDIFNGINIDGNDCIGFDLEGILLTDGTRGYNINRFKLVDDWADSILREIFKEDVVYVKA